MVDRIKLGGGQAGRGDAEQADAQIMQRVQFPSHKSRHGLDKPEKNQDQWADGGEPLKQREAKLDVCGWASGAGDLDTLAALGAGAAFSS